MSYGKGTVNKVILIGRLGADPELKYTTSGQALAKFNLATNRTWKDKEGNKQEKTDWHWITAWGKLAEIMGEWLKKGSLIYLEGRLQTRSYEDKSGVKKWVTEIVADNLEMLGSKGNGGGKPADRDSDSDNVPPPPADTDKEDDLPF